MLAVSGTALVWLKCVRNIVAPPVVIVTDCKDVSFAFPTRFKSHLVSINFFFLKLHLNSLSSATRNVCSFGNNKHFFLFSCNENFNNFYFRVTLVI